MPSPRLAARRARTRRSRRRRTTIAVVAVVVAVFVVAALAVLGIGWYYTNQLLDVSHEPSPFDLSVRSVQSVGGSRTVTLQRTADTARPGEYGLFEPGRSAVLGPVSQVTATAVTRKVLAGDPVAGRGRLDSDVWDADPLTARGVPYVRVSVAGPLGPMPAWLVNGSAHRDTWVVMVHGRGDSPKEGLRALPAVASTGLPVLDITYRNDVGAPASPDGLDHLGDTEWQDLAAAVRFAQARGAQHVVLYGWSMGGAIIGAFLERAPEARSVSALVLDSPVIDWRATLRLQAANRSLPAPLTDVAEWLTTQRIGIAWDSFDLLAHPAVFARPVLLFAGDADTTVPVQPARAVAARYRTTVTYVEVRGADHTEAWNVDPAAYDAAVSRFLQARAA